jgi:transcriptional regulator with XRE-family HTH domain
VAQSPSDVVIATQFFKGLGGRIRQLRERAGYSQEDMISFGYTVRYWQRVERGKPITLRTLLRICRILGVSVQEVVRGLGPERVISPTRIKKS